MEVSNTIKYLPQHWYEGHVRPCDNFFTSPNGTRVGSHKSQVKSCQFMQSQPLRAWKLGLTTSHIVPSPKSQLWHGCLHNNTIWRWSLGLVLRVGLSKKLDPTLNTNLVNIYAQDNKDLTLMIVILISSVSSSSKVRTLPPCWDLLTRLGIWDPMNWP
jgi:hypothetical protein